MNSKIRLNDNFFKLRQDVMEKATLGSSIKQCKDTGRIDSFLLRAPEKKDVPYPHIFWDSDFAKVVEGMALCVKLNPKSKLRKKLDQYVDLIVSAQQPDGYLNTHFTVVDCDQRWKNLNWDHELYCAGHLTEAAVAHYEATGSKKFIDCVCRYADLIASVFGRGEGQKRGYPGHEELELALVKLYRTTKKKKYLKLAKYFIDERGQEPNYFVEKEGVKPWDLTALQADKPIREQTEAFGHAVRATYLFSGATDVAVETKDDELLAVCEKYFDNITTKKMYITGGIGSSREGERFSLNYVLPNLNAYTESCASIGLVFFAHRLLKATGKSKYADVIERELYNGALSGLSLSGDKYFYVNPLSVTNDANVLSSIKKVRQEWYGCSCCPTNYCRFLPQLQDFCYRTGEKELDIDIPAAAKIETDNYTAEITGNYPYEGKVQVKVQCKKAVTVKIRIMDFCRGKCDMALNGKPLSPKISDGYAILTKLNGENVIECDFPIEPKFIFANPKVNDCCYKAALTMGPVVYAFEGVDNPGRISLYALDTGKKIKRTAVRGLPEGVVALECSGCQIIDTDSDDLYSDSKPKVRQCKLIAIPYQWWQNRGETEMSVYLPLKPMEGK